MAKGHPEKQSSERETVTSEDGGKRKEEAAVTAPVEPVAQPVKVKRKRKFTWTDKRREAFERCRAKRAESLEAKKNAGASVRKPASKDAIEQARRVLEAYEKAKSIEAKSQATGGDERKDDDEKPKKKRVRIKEEEKQPEPESESESEIEEVVIHKPKKKKKKKVKRKVIIHEPSESDESEVEEPVRMPPVKNRSVAPMPVYPTSYESQFKYL